MEFKLFPFILIICSLLFSLEVPLEVVNWENVIRTNEPVTMGVPLPAGSVYDLTKLRLVDRTGSTVPAQFKALSRWWWEKLQGRTDNPSVKWLLCDFSMSVPAKNKVDLTLKDDNSAGPASTSLSVTETASGMDIITGPLKLVLSKNSFTLFEYAYLDKNNDKNFTSDEAVLVPGNSGGFITAGSWSAGECIDGTIHSTSQQQVERMVVEESGPLKAIIRVEGRHYAASNSVSRGLYGFRVFITAYADKPYVDVQYAVTNTYLEGDKMNLGDNPYTVFVWPFKSYNLDFNLNLGGSGTYKLLGATEVTGNLSSTAVRLLQQKTNYTITGQSGGVDAKGGVSVSNGSMGMRIAMRHFAPNQPKGISVSNNKLSMELFPNTGSDYWLDPFSRKNLQMRFEFFSGSPSVSLTDFALQTDTPIRMLARPEWYQHCRLWDRGFGIPPSNTWRRRGPGEWTRLQKSSALTDWTTFGELGGFNGGGSHWNLTSCYWGFLLTGIPKEFESAEARTFYTNDLVSVHVSSNRWQDLDFVLNPEKDLAAYSKTLNPAASGVHYYADVKSFSGFSWHRRNTPDVAHLPQMQLIEYYQLTGDHATLDAIKDLGVMAVSSIFYRTYGNYGGWRYPDHNGEKVDPNQFIAPMGHCGRAAGRALAVACQAYDLTADDRYFYPMTIYALGLRNAAQRNPIGYLADINYSATGDTAYWVKNHPGVPAPAYFSTNDMCASICIRGLHSYWLITRDEEARDAIIFAGKSGEWRAGKEGGHYTGFTYSGWGDYLTDGHRYNDSMKQSPYWTSSAAEGCQGTVMGYLASGRADLWNVMVDARPNYEPDFYYSPSHFPQMENMALWQAVYEHDSLDNVPPAAITDLQATKVDGAGILLSWTAPGDDNMTGQAAEYQIKYHEGPIVDFVKRWDPAAKTGWPDLNDPLPYAADELLEKCRQYNLTQEIAFWACENVKNEPAPQTAGTQENFLLTGLESNKQYNLALVSFDRKGNVSGLSNVVSITTGIENGYEQNGNFISLGSQPNPFNPCVKIKVFLIPGRSKMLPLSVLLYNARGQLVRTLSKGRKRPGSLAFVWYGRDDSMKQVPSGIYFCRMKSGANVLQHKLILVR